MPFPLSSPSSAGMNRATTCASPWKCSLGHWCKDTIMWRINLSRLQDNSHGESEGKRVGGGEYNRDIWSLGARQVKFVDVPESQPPFGFPEPR